MFQKMGKIWGNTTQIFDQNNVEVHRIEGQVRGYSSIHKHEHKFNMFYLEHGKLEITIYRNDAGQEIDDVTILTAGQSTIVEPGLYHRFRVIDPCIAFEIYYTLLDRNDIIRKTMGGI